MKTAQILHNTKSGDANFSKEELISLLETNGYKAHYASLKEDGWDNFKSDVDFLVICGGDGSVKKVVKTLIEQKLEYPLALIPAGTANNFAKSLKLDTDVKQLVRSWDIKNLKNVDCWEISHGESQNIMIESFGIGVFPDLMQRMIKLEEKEEKAEDELDTAKKELAKIVQRFKGVNCEIEAGGKIFSGSYLLIEAMNTLSIGPGLNLAGDADLSDGNLSVVLVSLDERKELENYVVAKIRGEDHSFRSETLKVKDLSISWEGANAHIDDQNIYTEERCTVHIKLKKPLRFFANSL